MKEPFAGERFQLLNIETSADCRPAPRCFNLAGCGGNATAQQSRWRLSQLLRCPSARSPRQPRHHHRRQHTRPGQQRRRPGRRNAPRHPHPGQRGPKWPAGSRGQCTGIFTLRRSSNSPTSKAVSGHAPPALAVIAICCNGAGDGCGNCANLPRPPTVRICCTQLAFTDKELRHDPKFFWGTSTKPAAYVALRRIFGRGSC